MDTNITETLADFAARLRYETLPEPAVDAAKRVLLDWLGNVYAGSATRAGQIMAELAAEEGGVPEAALLGQGRRTSALFAALVNGACAHSVEFDDIYKNALYHPGAPTIAAALAMAEKRHAGGSQLIAAIVAGYEVGTRIAEAVSPSHYRYWHTTATVGTFGAAAAAGNILGLSPEQMAWAMGNAGSQAAGLWQFIKDGQTMTKPLHAGKAASNGVLSALLAQRGFNGAHRILEGEKGFCNATSDGWDFSEVLPTLGSQYNIARTTFKMYSCCGHTHPAIDATLAIRKAYGIGPEEAARIRVRTYSVATAIADNPSPVTTHQAQFSIPYCVAVALRFGRARMAEFEQERIKDPETTAVMQRIEVVSEDELSAMAPAKRPAIVEITTNEGRTFSHRVDFRKGDPENPPTPRELEDKFRALASSVLPGEAIRATMEKLARLEQIEDVTTLLGN
jgi:2-methylcitrate dehydratase PrpD